MREGALGKTCNGRIVPVEFVEAKIPKIWSWGTRTQYLGIPPQERFSNSYTLTDTIEGGFFLRKKPLESN
jgi:hypothetical protein